MPLPDSPRCCVRRQLQHGDSDVQSVYSTLAIASSTSAHEKHRASRLSLSQTHMNIVNMKRKRLSPTLALCALTDSATGTAPLHAYPSLEPKSRMYRFCIILTQLPQSVATNIHGSGRVCFHSSAQRCAAASAAAALSSVHDSHIASSRLPALPCACLILMS